MLMKPAPSRLRRTLGVALIVSASMLTGVAAWAAQPHDPSRMVPPAPPAPPPAPAMPVPPAPPAPPPTAVMPAPPVPPLPPVPPTTPLPPPMYPAQALKQGIGGTVILQIDVGADGKPTHVVVDRANPPGVFDDAAVAAAKRWRFDPKLQDGHPVATRVQVPITFAPHAPHASTPLIPAG